MQNTNELRSLESTGNEHPNSNSNNPIDNQNVTMESLLHEVVIPEDQKGEIIHDGFNIDITPNYKNTQILDEQKVNLVNVLFTPDEMLDDINLSDDEEVIIIRENNNKDPLTQSEYKQEMKKICDLYDPEDESMNKYTGTKNEAEIRKEIPVAFNLEENDILIEAGMIEDIIEMDKIIVKVNIFNGILDLDNIIFNENKMAIGYLDDVIGKVESPYYMIKMFPNLKENILNININEHFINLNLITGKSLFFAKTKSRQIVPGNLMKMKGCDASNAFDEEVNDDEMEFSDDEQEIKNKSRKKGKNSINSKVLTEYEEYFKQEATKKKKVEVNNMNFKSYNEDNNNKNNFGVINNNSHYTSEYKLGGNTNMMGVNQNVQMNQMNNISQINSMSNMNTMNMLNNNNPYNMTQLPYNNMNPINQIQFNNTMNPMNPMNNINNMNMFNFMMMNMNQMNNGSNMPNTNFNSSTANNNLNVNSTNYMNFNQINPFQHPSSK